MMLALFGYARGSKGGDPGMLPLCITERLRLLFPGT